MGQLVGVVEKPSTTPGVVRFELNRSLSGMGHERFTSVDQAIGPKPSSALARLLFATGQVAGIHIYGNIVTVDIAKGFDSSGLGDIVRGMYQYWKPGVVPPAFEDLVADEPAAVAPGAGDGGGESELSEAAKRVPSHLLERSRAARAKWKAANGG
jgi:hypothetical protein